MKTIIISFLLVISLTSQSETTLIIYDAPKGTASAPEFELEVNGQKVFEIGRASCRERV